MTGRPLPLLMGAGLFCLILLAAFVWLTPYRYVELREAHKGRRMAQRYRVNRFTGAAPLLSMVALDPPAWAAHQTLEDSRP
jgi:hypothetical protein